MNSDCETCNSDLSESVSDVSGFETPQKQIIYISKNICYTFHISNIIYLFLIMICIYL